LRAQSNDTSPHSTKPSEQKLHNSPQILFLCDGASANGFCWLVSALLLELVGACFSVSESVHQFCPIVCEMVETLFVNWPFSYATRIWHL